MHATNRTDHSAKPTVAILYGLAEGKGIGKTFCHALQRRGFACTNDVMAADIIVAHSGGALLVPQQSLAQTVLLIAPITGYQGSWSASTFRKVRQDFRAARSGRTLRQWTRKSAHNWIYLATKQGSAWRMLFQAKTGRRELPRIANKRVGVIALRNDPWSGYLAKVTYDHLPYAFIHLNHLHDDLWSQPDDYITILEHIHAA